MSPPTCAIYAVTAEQRMRVDRTRRALERLGVAALDRSDAPLAAAAAQLEAGPVWLVRAGTWPRAFTAWPAPSDTGAVVCALGAVNTPEGVAALGREAAAWAEVLRATGGDLSRMAQREASLPPLGSTYLDATLAPLVLGRVRQGEPLEVALAAVLAGRRARVVRLASLDVFADARLRVAQVVTSIQQGGAERVAVELASELPRLDIRARVFALYAARRPALCAPADTLEVASLTRRPEALIETLAQQLTAWGTDVVHAHLLDAHALDGLAARGHRSLVTVHNTAASWPAGLERLAPSAAALLVGCAHAMEAEVAEHELQVPRRTVYNGIRPAPPGAPGWRERMGVPADALLLLAVANPRPQKRLPLLPAITAAVQATLERAGSARSVHLVIAGSPLRSSELAATAMDELEQEIDRAGLAARVHLVGSVSDVAGLLAAADVLVSPSLHEGLSLAHLEALAAAVPVVATGAGGTAELAALTGALTHLPLDTDPEAFARAVLAAVHAGAADGPRVVHERFGVDRMARGYARLYSRALARQRARPGDGVLIVTNNFSTGGAQSSARRLLLAFQARGVRARAAVIEEQPEYPTIGRRALTAAGISVLALPPPADLPASESVGRLLQAIDADPPRAVLLWNVITEHKLRLAEGLLDVPLFDVSPGEMYFASLQRYFAAPHPELPYRTERDYGARLAGVVVKFAAEAERAHQVLGRHAHVIPNGVPLGPCPAPRLERGLLVIGTAARIHPDKRLADLLAALRLAAPRLPPYVLRIAGGVDTGAEQHAAELRELARGLNVEWRGELADPRAFLADLDLFTLVAEPEGCPNASLEAMATGLPIIATAVGGMLEQLDSPSSGWLVPPRDAPALANAIVELARAPERRACMGRAAWERARSHFSMDVMVQSYGLVCGVLDAGSLGRERHTDGRHAPDSVEDDASLPGASL